MVACKCPSPLLCFVPLGLMSFCSKSVPCSFPSHCCSCSVTSSTVEKSIPHFSQTCLCVFARCASSFFFLLKGPAESQPGFLLGLAVCFCRLYFFSSLLFGTSQLFTLSFGSHSDASLFLVLCLFLLRLELRSRHSWNLYLSFSISDSWFSRSSALDVRKRAGVPSAPSQ